MTPELTILAWTVVLALVHILITATLRTRETGLAYNAGPRDMPARAPVGKVTARMMRAQANFYETLPLFIIVVFIANAAHVHTAATHWGALLYFWGRVFYIPLYAFGIPYLRSVVWFASLIGIIMLSPNLILPAVLN